MNPGEFSARADGKHNINSTPPYSKIVPNKGGGAFLSEGAFLTGYDLMPTYATKENKRLLAQVHEVF